MQPRIYTYKITFPDQGWWYWGVHKERRYGESYWGSPTTHKAKWENFEFEKQILEFFDSYEEALRVEKRLIKPDLDNPLCLNEGCSTFVSLASAAKGGRNCPRETQVQNGINEQKRRKDLGISAFNTSPEQLKINGSNVGNYSWKNKTGSFTPELTKQRHDKLRNMNTERWRCLVTGFITSPGPLSRYQKARGIDTSLREKVV